MEEVYSDECQPGIKYSFNKLLITSSYAKDLQHVWQPLYKLIKGSEKVILTYGMYLLIKNLIIIVIFHCIFMHLQECVFLVKVIKMQFMIPFLKVIYDQIFNII